MNENIDLTKILKNCPNGWKLWSPIFGEVEFELNEEKLGFVSVTVRNGDVWSFNANATITIDEIQSTEIMIYPSKDQRDWNKFTAPWYKKEKFDPHTLQPFDKVLVRASLHGDWRVSLFSHEFMYELKKADAFCCVAGVYMICIPYNDDTKHLVGTTEDAPEYYKYWNEDQLSQ